MTTRQYIGARYVPVFADPVEWDDERAYEPLVMVQHLGETYMTKQAVPIGVQLPDTSQGEESNEFWVHMSNWNAQVETYRQEVLQYNSRIAECENDLPIADFDSTHTVSDAITATNALLPATSFDSTNTVAAAIAAVNDLLPASAFDSTNTVDARFDVIEANNWVTNQRMADNSVGTSEIQNGAITKTKLAGRQLLFIGDSYAVGWNPSEGDGSSFVDYCIQYLGLTLNTNAFKNVASGYGFSNTNGKFITLLNNATVTDEDLITDIVVCGGTNDALISEATVKTDIASFMTAALTRFPNAQVHVGMISGDVNSSIYNALPQLINSYQTAAKASNGNYISNIEYILCDKRYLSSDGTHPLRAAHQVLGEHLANYIKGGSIDIVRPTETIANTDLSSWQVPNVRWSQNNNMECLEFPSAFTPQYGIYPGELFTLASISGMPFRGIGNIVGICELDILKQDNSHLYMPLRIRTTDQVIQGMAMRDDTTAIGNITSCSIIGPVYLTSLGN